MFMRKQDLTRNSRKSRFYSWCDVPLGLRARGVCNATSWRLFYQSLFMSL